MFEARFQSFEDRAERGASGPRVKALRTELARRGLTGWIVPRADPHQNEYVPASERRPARPTARTGPNRVSAIGTARPPPRLGRIKLHDIRFAGETAEDKLLRIRAEIAKLKADALVVSDPHAVAWTFNIRGSDVAHTPLPLSFAIVPKEGRPTLYIDGAKLSNAVRHKLEEATEAREPGAFIGDLKSLGGAHRSV